MGSVTLGTNNYEVIKARLWLWLELSSIHEQLTEAVEHKNFGLFSELIISYVSTAFSIDNADEFPWEEVVDAFIAISAVNTLDFDIPLLAEKATEEQKVAWSYVGRTWYLWASMFAKSFGWTLQTIADLEVEDAIKLFQEILVHEQLQKEWEWALSDHSTTYDKASQTSKPNPLPRPFWMTVATHAQKRIVVEIPEHLMPLGNVIHAKH